MTFAIFNATEILPKTRVALFAHVRLCLYTLLIFASFCTCVAASMLCAMIKSVCFCVSLQHSLTKPLCFLSCPAAAGGRGGKATAAAVHGRSEEESSSKGKAPGVQGTHWGLSLELEQFVLQFAQE